MKAVRYHGYKDIRVDKVPDPRIRAATDIILRVTSTAICDADLHIYDGQVAQERPLTLGREFMGIIEEVGSAVRKFRKDERVVVPFTIACGYCYFCTHELPGHCENSNPDKYGPDGGMLEGKGGGLFGYTDLYGGYDGGQAEYVRIPYADIGPRRVPNDMSDEQLLFLTDIFPTGYSAVDLAGVQGGETVAVFGCGPVGLMAQKVAWLRGAKRVIALDVQDYRLAMAGRVCGSETINVSRQEAKELIRSMTQGRGADVCIDAVGTEPDRAFTDQTMAAIHPEKRSINALRMCLDSVRRGGTVAVLGVYGDLYHDFPLGQVFDKAITLRTGQAPVHKYIDTLIELVSEGRIKLDDIITHRMSLDEAPHAYDITAHKKDDCVKVVMKP